MKLNVIKDLPTQISHAEESQIIYADTVPPKKCSTTHRSVSMAAHSDFLPERTVWKGGKKE